jgi:hypothetical protein
MAYKIKRKVMEDYIPLSDKIERLLDSTMRSVNRKSREAGYGNIMKKTEGGKF